MTVSESSKKELLEVGLDSQHIHVVHNGVTLPKIIKEYKKEKALFKERLGGKTPCYSKGVVDFTESGMPSKQCIYPSGGYIRVGDEFGQYPKLLKVFQILPKGFLVQHAVSECFGSAGCIDRPNQNLLYVHRTTEENIVDGAYLDEANPEARFEYAGPYSYESKTGARTVHSFKMMVPGAIAEAVKGLKVYDPRDELLAETGLWNKLEDSLQSSSQKK
jgi:hypothetical protein